MLVVHWSLVGSALQLIWRAVRKTKDSFISTGVPPVQASSSVASGFTGGWCICALVRRLAIVKGCCSLGVSTLFLADRACSLRVLSRAFRFLELEFTLDLKSL